MFFIPSRISSIIFDGFSERGLSDNAEIGKLCGYLTHYGALCSVSVASAAEYGYYSFFGDFAKRRNYIFEPVGRMCLVDYNRIIRIGWHNLNSALNSV